MKPLTPANKRELDAIAEKSIAQAAAGDDVTLTFPNEAERQAAVPYLLAKLKKHGLALDKPYRAEKMASNNAGGPGVNGKPQYDPAATESAEADAILKLVTEESAKELQAAKAAFLDPKTNSHVKQVCWSLLKGLVQDSLKGEQLDPLPPAHDANDLSEVAKAEIALKAAKSPTEKEQAGSKLTLERLKALHERYKPVSAAIKSIENDPAIEALKQRAIDYPDLPADVKDQIGQLVTKHQLEKSFASEQQAKTDSLVATTQARVQANPQSASGPANTGFSQKEKLAMNAELVKLEAALVKSTDKIERANIAEKITYHKLTKLHS